MKAIIYCRKSSEAEEKQALSIEAQLEWCNEQARRLECQVVEIITEEMSAKAPGRPGFNKMMGLFAEKKADIIISWKLNRLARNPIDEGTIKWLCQSFTIQEIHTIDGISNGHNILLMSVHFGMATQYVIDLSKDIKRGMRQKAKNGGWGRTTPLGYKIINKEVFLDETTSPIIKKIFKLKHEEKLNNAEIAEIANNMGLRTKSRKFKGVEVGNKEVDHKIIGRILENKFYYGLINHLGEYFEGKHQPIIDKRLWEEVNAKQKKKYIKHHVGYFKGIIRDLETGEPYLVTKKKKKLKSGEKVEYIYYFKKGIKGKFKSIWISERYILNLFLENLQKYELPKEFSENFKNALYEYHYNKLDDNNSSKEQLEKIIKELERKKSGYTDMRANGELSHEDFIEKKNFVVDEILDNKERIKQIDKLDDEMLTRVSFLAELMETLSTKAKTKFFEKNISLGLLAQLIFFELKVDKEKRLYIQEKPLFQYIKSWQNHIWWS